MLSSIPLLPGIGVDMPGKFRAFKVGLPLRDDTAEGAPDADVDDARRMYLKRLTCQDECQKMVIYK